MRDLVELFWREFCAATGSDPATHHDVYAFGDTDVWVAPLNTVDAAFAYDKGEGDRTLGWWQAAHEQYFRRALPAIGIEFDDGLGCAATPVSPSG